MKFWLIRKLGMKSFGGEATLANLFTKKALAKMNLGKESRTYIFFRRIYRKTGKVSKLESSFSSFGEDRVLVKYLPELVGDYIDVGAGAPIKGSNTFFFYKRGWRGTTIDPIVAIIKLHKKKRPYDIQINACVTDESDIETKFYQYLADDFSTNSANRVTELADKNIHPQKTYAVPVISLRELKHFCNPLSPSFLNIDVEGGELGVLMSNNWDLCKPRVIAIEEWESPIYSKTEVRLYLESLNYRLTSRCFLTSIYVHIEYLQTLAESERQSFGWFNP